VETVEISQAERERVVSTLTKHCGDGRLTLDELEERVAEVYAATSRAEIDHALRHLPATITTPPQAPTTAMRRVEPSTPAKTPGPSGNHAEVALRVHLAVYLSVMAFLVVIWLLTTPFGYFWPIWPALGWGLAVAIHAGVTKAAKGS
jgi:hypothetical protein